MKSQIPAPSVPVFAPQPVGGAQPGVLHGTLARYSRRFFWLGAVIALLLVVVSYLYEAKVGEPMQRLEGDVQTQVLTHPAPAEAVTQAPVDEAPSQVNEAAQAAAVLPWTEGVAATAMAPASADTVYRGEGAQCPADTNRMIYIGEQALCCHGNTCTEAQ